MLEGKSYDQMVWQWSHHLGPVLANLFMGVSLTKVVTII